MKFSSQELANKVADLECRHALLEKRWFDAGEKCALLPDGVETDQAAYLKAKKVQRDLKSQMTALGVQIAEFKKQGREALESEAETRSTEAAAERGRLLRERQAAIREQFIPLEEKWFILQESLNGEPVSYDYHERKLLIAEVDRLRKETPFPETLAGQLRAVESDLAMFTRKTYPSFQQMVDQLVAAKNKAENFTVSQAKNGKLEKSGNPKKWRF